MLSEIAGQPYRANPFVACGQLTDDFFATADAPVPNKQHLIDAELTTVRGCLGRTELFEFLHHAWQGRCSAVDGDHNADRVHTGRLTVTSHAFPPRTHGFSGVTVPTASESGMPIVIFWSTLEDMRARVNTPPLNHFSTRQTDPETRWTAAAPKRKANAGKCFRSLAECRAVIVGPEL